MSAKGIKRKISKVTKEVDKLIADHASHGLYGGGLAAEGYNGGYRDALSDVLIALNGVTPNRNHWWK